MLSWLLGYLMIAKSMTKIYIITEITYTLFYVTIGHVYDNYFGIKGISIAFAINYFLYFILMLFILRKLLINYE